MAPKRPSKQQQQLNVDQYTLLKKPMEHLGKQLNVPGCSECGAESAPAGQRLPAAGRDLAWAARTGSGPMWMCGDIFAAARRWRGRLLTTGRLSCRHPVVVCAGRGRGVAVAGRAVAWACSGRGAAICVRVSSSVNHL